MEDVFIKKDDLNEWIAKYFPNQDLISIDDLLACIEDLTIDIEHLEEEFEDFKKDVEDNYVSRYVDKYDECGVSRRDFY